jgi:hypothetical protein
LYRASLHELAVRRSRTIQLALRDLATLVCVPMLCALLGCAAGTPAPTTSQLCVPGDQKACACPGQAEGVQVCADDGSRYGECTGCAAGTGGKPGTTGVGGMTIVGGSGGAPGTGGRGTGGTTDAGAGAGGAGDAATIVDAPAGTGGATGAAGATGMDGGAVDGAGAVDGSRGIDASAGPDGGAGNGGGDAGSDVPIVAAGVPITPGSTGLVLGSSNVLGVQGPWYAYADGMGGDGSTATGICEARGGHVAAACSQVATPAVGSFPNVGGKMCTSGTAAMIIAGAGGLPDYANITGAGIGLDLNNSGGAVPVRGVFNATTKGVTGVAFDLQIVALPGLRVEFPTPATDVSSTGAAYWGANAAFPSSPAVAGSNVIRWADVRIPAAAAPAFDPTMIESILFHVPTTIAAPGPYSFCISNLKLLTN